MSDEELAQLQCEFEGLRDEVAQHRGRISRNPPEGRVPEGPVLAVPGQDADVGRGVTRGKT
jgi:hypothetical protein